MRGAISDNLFEIVCAANFLFEVEFFFGELVFQRVDFLEGQRVFDGDGDLRGDLLDQFDILCAENIGAAAGEVERAERAAAVGERDAANSLQSFGAQEAHDFAGILVELGAARDEGRGLRRWRGRPGDASRGTIISGLSRPWRPGKSSA